MSYLSYKLQNGFGGIISLCLNGGETEARCFLENVKLFALAESLGDIESLIEHPAIMTHVLVPEQERLKLGISDSLIHISVGIENVDDLQADLAQALQAIYST